MVHDEFILLGGSSSRFIVFIRLACLTMAVLMGAGWPAGRR